MVCTVSGIYWGRGRGGEAPEDRADVIFPKLFWFQGSGFRLQDGRAHLHNAGGLGILLTRGF